MKKLALALLVAAALTSCKVQGQAPAQFGGKGCHIVAPGADNENADHDFYAWRDAVSEDGRIDYEGSRTGRWVLHTWDGKVEVLGWSLQEDSTIWSTRACANS